MEDRRLLAGRGRFVDDVDRHGQLWMRVVRASVAAGTIAELDPDAALAVPGVHAVLAGSDLRPLPHVPVRLGPFDVAPDPFLQPVLADGRVRYVGEPVAVVVAEDPYLAEDAAELVAVRYDETSPVIDARQAPANEIVAMRRGFGDVDAGFARAAHVVEVELRIGRHTAVPLEPRGLVAEYEPGADRLTVWGATKVPHFNRGALAGMLGMPEERVVLRATDAGGGFGVRGELYPEDFLVAYLTRQLGRPVKWIEDRLEHMVATNHSREQERVLAGAFDGDGRLLALRDEVFHDNGAYLRTHGLLVPELTLAMLAGPYRVPAYEGVAHVVLTNKTPCGTYRAPGRYEATFARERLLDRAAHELDIDRIELRRRNLLSRSDLPHRRDATVLGHPVEIESGDPAEQLETALSEAGWERWSQEAEALRADGRLVGVGLACFLEKSGGGGYETARVTVTADGRVRAMVGAASLGQGIETVVARVVAGELAVEPSDVEVIAGDTELVATGSGSWASRSTIFAGGAATLAARAVATYAQEVAAELLEAAPEDLELRRDGIAVVGGGSAALPLAAVAEACGPVDAARRGRPPGLEAVRTFADAPMTYPYGVHLAQVEVDRDTGAVQVRRYHVVYEVGKAVDRRLVEGQLIGGVLQGVGGALLEELRFDAAGQPQSTTFIDYLLPTAGTVPSIATTVLEDAPASGNPLGAMGAGEGGVTGCGAAVAAAVDDALGVAGAITALPISPDVVREAIDMEESHAAIPAAGPET